MSYGPWYVVVEINQASKQPKLAVEDVFDVQEEAEELAADMTDENRRNDRRETYIVFELEQAT